MQTFLNPFGRIDPVTFRNAALVLIATGAFLGLLPLINPGLAIVSFASMVLIYPWVVIWIKRFHDAGKSGAMFFAVFVPWLVTGILANQFIVKRFVDVPPVDPNFIWASMVAQLQASALAATISGAIISLAFTLVVNEELKSDPAENAFGPPPGP